MQRTGNCILYTMKFNFKMNSSLKDEVIYLILKGKHEDPWTINLHSNCTNNGKYKKHSISEEPDISTIIIFCYNYCSCLIFRELSLFKTVSLKMFSGTTICDNWDSLLMGPRYSEIQAQCTSTSKLLSKLSGQGFLQLCFWSWLSERDYPIHHLPTGRWPSQATLHRLCYQQRCQKLLSCGEREEVSEKCFQIEPRGRGLWDCCIIAAGGKYCVKCARSLLQRHHESSVSSTQRPSLRTLVSVLPDSSVLPAPTHPTSVQPPTGQPTHQLVLRAENQCHLSDCCSPGLEFGSHLFFF